MNDQISPAVINRMPRYYRYLDELLKSNVERISSKSLSERMHVTASQIRQDLNNFGGFGQQGYGYNVEYLHNEIGNILGINKKHNVIIIGIGHIGQAIANYENFKTLGFNTIGFFDVDDKIIGKEVLGVKVKDVKELDKFSKENKIDIAALTLPKYKAKEMAEKILNLGIKAIWNFALVDLEVPDDVIVENVHLSESLLRLSYRINKSDKN